MSAQLLNDLLSAFTQALDAGTVSLGGYSLGLLAIAVTLAWYKSVGISLLLSGGAGVAEGIAAFLLLLLKLGITWWILLYLPDMTDAAFRTFAQWGSAVSGGRFTAQTFQNPAEILDTGFRIGRTIRELTDNVGQWLTQYPTTMVGYSLAYYGIVIGFGVLGLHLMATLLEFKFAVLVATLFVPWAVFPDLAFFAEFVVAWLAGALVRVLLTAVMIGIGYPVLRPLTLTLTATEDPSFYGALALGGAALVFAILAWYVPSRGAAIASRGVSLGLTGSELLSGAGTAARFVTLGVQMPTAAMRGVSRLLAGR